MRAHYSPELSRFECCVNVAEVMLKVGISIIPFKWLFIVKTMNTPASQTTLPVYHKPDLQLRHPLQIYALKHSFHCLVKDSTVRKLT